MTQQRIDPDSLIFDMDGTLWDAVDSYCKVWEKTFDDAGIAHTPVSREQLLAMMGMHLEDIIARLAPQLAGNEKFLSLLDANERSMMPVLSGRFYPGVRETIARLSVGRRLFMVSNCGSHGLENFINLAGIRPSITEALSHGSTGKTKAQNISDLIERYGLKLPYYVGDTQSDADAARAAGAKMIFCSYGFGHVTQPDITIDCFNQLNDIIVLHHPSGHSD